MASSLDFPTFILIVGYSDAAMAVYEHNVVPNREAIIERFILVDFKDELPFNSNLNIVIPARLNWLVHDLV